MKYKVMIRLARFLEDGEYDGIEYESEDEAKEVLKEATQRDDIDSAWITVIQEDE